MSKKYKRFRMGLCYSRKKLAWTCNGFLWWMPEFVKQIIVRAWNKIACFIWGHYWFPDFVWKKNKPVSYKSEICLDCCKERERLLK